MKLKYFGVGIGILLLLFLISFLIMQKLNTPDNEAANLPPAQTEKTSVSDIIISGTFKSLCKGYIAVSDVEGIKKKLAAKMAKMSDEKFKKSYGKAYTVLKDMPPDILKEYNLTEDMSRGQAIKNLELLNKKKVYKLIDEIPDKAIADQFRGYLRKTNQDLQNSNAVKQIQAFWNKCMGKMEK